MDSSETRDASTRREFLGVAAGSFALAAGAPVERAARADEGASLVVDPPRELVAGGADLGTLSPEIERLADGRVFELSYAQGRLESLEEYKREGRARLLDCLGRRPEPAPARPEIVDREDCGEFFRERVLFSTAAEFRVAAYVLIPKKGRAEPAPAIVDLHSHGGMFLFGKEKVIDFGKGRNHPVMVDYHQRNYGGRPTATEFARRGYVTITIDALMFGERRVMRDADIGRGWDRSKYSVETARELNAVCRSKEATIVKSLTLAGCTWPGLVAWDDMRTVDYLLTRPEVDPKRIGCVGVSMGGHRSLYLSGLDERIAAACVTGFLSTVRPMMRRHLDTHSFVHFVPGLHRFLDLPDVVALHAPKPLLVQQCREDGLFPPEGMTAAVDKISAAYDRAKAKDRFFGRFHDGGHRFDVPMQEEAIAFFDRWL